MIVALYRKLFGEKKPEMKYTISLRGLEMAQAPTIEDAEEFIREQFEYTDNRRVGGRGFGTDQNTSKSKRVAAFRNQWQIRPIKTVARAMGD